MAAIDDSSNHCLLLEGRRHSPVSTECADRGIVQVSFGLPKVKHERQKLYSVKINPVEMDLNYLWVI